MKCNIFLTLIVVSLSLLGCDSKPKTEQPQGVLTETQKQTLQKAKEVENVLLEADKKRKEAIGE